MVPSADGVVVEVGDAVVRAGAAVLGTEAVDLGAVAAGFDLDAVDFREALGVAADVRIEEALAALETLEMLEMLEDW